MIPSAPALPAFDRLVGRGVGPPDLDLWARFDAGASGHVDLVVADGTIVAAGPPGQDPLSRQGRAPDVVVRATEDALAELIVGPIARPARLLERLEVGDVVGRWVRPVPLDDASAGLEDVTSIPGADLSCCFRVHGTLVGSVVVADRWSDGRRAAWRLLDDGDPLPDADLVVELPVELLHAVRTGAVESRAAVEAGAGVVGDWPALMLLVGLVERPEARAAWRGASASVEGQVALASVLTELRATL